MNWKFWKLQGLKSKTWNYSVETSPSPKLGWLNGTFAAAVTPVAGDGEIGHQRPPNAPDREYQASPTHSCNHLHQKRPESTVIDRRNSPSPASFLWIDSFDSRTSATIWRHVQVPGITTNMMVSSNFPSTSRIKKPQISIENIHRDLEP